MNVSGLFLEFSRWKLVDEYWPRLRGAVESLTAEQVWWRPNDASNSIGNLILHLDGNVRQWLISGVGGAPDVRQRSTEFAAQSGTSSKELLAQLERTLDEVAPICALSEADLLRAQHPGYHQRRGGGVQVVEHFGMHYGQILCITKLVRGRT